jgi:hypothetical protein
LVLVGVFIDEPLEATKLAAGPSLSLYFVVVLELVFLAAVAPRWTRRWNSAYWSAATSSGNVCG